MTDVTSVTVAAIGVAGTLAAPALASAAARRAKRQEINAEYQREANRRAEEEFSELRAEKKRCYMRHNVAAGDYLVALEEWSYGQERGTVSPPDSFLPRRLEYRASYAEAQMIVADDVLPVARQVNDALSDAFAMLKRLEEGVAHDGDTPVVARVKLQTCWGPLRTMRSLMRTDLGTAAVSRDSSEPPGQHRE